ncbi:MAG: hypothetical protein V1754_11765 [Pseudomonadota bacterium]
MAKKKPFGFNLSARQFNQIRNQLASGNKINVRVHTQVATDTGTLPVLSATLKGCNSPSERIVIVANLSSDEPALSSACVCEILRILSGAVVRGDIAPPTRSIQLLFVPGTAGTSAWLENASQHGLKTALEFSVPSSLSIADFQVQTALGNRPSFVPDLCEENLRWATGSQGRLNAAVPSVFPFTTQHTTVAGTKIAGVHGPLQPHVLFAETLRRMVAGVAWSVVDLASLEDKDLFSLLCSAHFKSNVRHLERAKQLQRRIQVALSSGNNAKTVAQHLLWFCDASMAEGLRRERATIQSCASYLDNPGAASLRMAEISADLEQTTNALLRSIHTEVRAHVESKARLSVKRRPISAIERRASQQVIHRTFDGPMPVPELMRDTPQVERTWLTHHANELAKQPIGEHLMQWVDGKRTLFDIYEILMMDFPHANLKLLWRYSSALEAAGLVQLELSPGISQIGN